MRVLLFLGDNLYLVLPHLRLLLVLLVLLLLFLL